MELNTGYLKEDRKQVFMGIDIANGADMSACVNLLEMEDIKKIVKEIREGRKENKDVPESKTWGRHRADGRGGLGKLD